MIQAMMVLSTRGGIETHIREDPHMGAIYAWAMNHVIDAGHKVESAY